MTIECLDCAGAGKKETAAGVTADCETCMGGGTIEVRALAHDSFPIMLDDGRCSYWSTGHHIIKLDGTCRCGRRFLIVEVIE